MPRTYCILQVAIAAATIILATSGHGGEESLAEAMKKVEKNPPDWLADVPVNYDTAQPWKKARHHIRKLLGQGGKYQREAIKLTYDYLVERKVQEDVHELPMYLYLGGERAWAIKVYEQWLLTQPKGQAHACQDLASCYLSFGETGKALDVLKRALHKLPDPPWRTMAEAKINDQMGDVYAKAGDKANARDHYQTAIRHYGVAKPRYGRHLLPRRIAKTQCKQDLLDKVTLDLSGLRNGVYQGRSLGYTKDLTATVRVKAGRMQDIKLHHKENIEQGATKIIPQRIVEKQSLHVDGVTGATITTQAIIEATYRALQKAGLR